MISRQQYGVRAGENGVLKVQRGEPVLYASLGAYLHLEPLEANDAACLEQALATLQQALGPNLKFTSASFMPGVSDYEESDLEYVSCSFDQLRQQQYDGEEEEQIYVAHLGRIALDDTEVLFKGGISPEVADPWSVSYWLEVPEVSAGDQHSRGYPILSFTVPLSYDLGAFYQLVLRVAAPLRLRWGNAGLAFARWEIYDILAGPKARYTFAQRYVGFDVGAYHRCVEPFYESIRSVSWLTFVGPELWERLPAKNQTEAQQSALLAVTHLGDTYCIQAGQAPDAGDKNSLSFPPAYVEADRLLRPIRAATSGGMTWLGPWDERSIEAWLRRFELVVT